MAKRADRPGNARERIAAAAVLGTRQVFFAVVTIVLLAAAFLGRRRRLRG